MSWTHGNHTLWMLAACAGLTAGASCVSGDEAPAGGRVAHPPARVSMPVASAEAPPDASPPAEGFTPLDQAIADDCRPFRPPAWSTRVWSQQVPDRDCTTDVECGDGFCDRGHCAAIKTCQDRYGQRCINHRPIPRHFADRSPKLQVCPGICLEGRCRSCQSDAECIEEFQARYPERRGPWDNVFCTGGPGSRGGRCAFHFNSHDMSPRP
jgi:hypothetical protein